VKSDTAVEPQTGQKSLADPRDVGAAGLSLLSLFVTRMEVIPPGVQMRIGRRPEGRRGEGGRMHGAEEDLQHQRIQRDEGGTAPSPQLPQVVPASVHVVQLTGRVSADQ